MAANLHSIAAECQVSAMTASRALDPVRQHTVASATRDRIVAVAARLGYQANPSARRLRSGRLQTITLVLGPRPSDPRRGTGFDALTDIRRWSVLQAVLRQARAYNYEVKIEASLILGDCAGIIENLRPDLTDGIIFDTASAMEPVIDYVIKNKIPRIVIRSMGALGIPECPYLQLDRRPGLESAYRYFLARGFRHFAFFGITGKETSQHLQSIFKTSCSNTDCGSLIFATFATTFLNCAHYSTAWARRYMAAPSAAATIAWRII